MYAAKRTVQTCHCNRLHLDEISLRSCTEKRRFQHWLMKHIVQKMDLRTMMLMVGYFLKQLVPFLQYCCSKAITWLIMKSFDWLNKKILPEKSRGKYFYFDGVRIFQNFSVILTFLSFSFGQLCSYYDINGSSSTDVCNSKMLLLYIFEPFETTAD